MFLALTSVNEWTLSKSTTDNHVEVATSGGAYIGYIYGVASSYAVRPTFYLNSDVKLAGGDGSILNPYRLK